MVYTDDKPLDERDEEHPLDESLGNIHECALALEFMGLTDWALKLARAHETIQTYLVGSDANT